MKKSAVTLIEMMIVILIMMILAGIAVPMFRRNRLMAQETRALVDLDTIRTAATMYHHDTEEWPPTGNTGAGLVNDDGVANWDGPYLTEWKRDPWNNTYELYDEGDSPTRRLIRSLGGETGEITLLLTPDISR